MTTICVSTISSSAPHGKYLQLVQLELIPMKDAKGVVKEQFFAVCSIHSDTIDGPTISSPSTSCSGRNRKDPETWKHEKTQAFSTFIEFFVAYPVCPL